jgi:hypothetical protein
MGVPYFVKIRSFTTVHGINTIVYDRKRAVYGIRISPYKVTEIYDRNTGPCITEKYGRIRSYTELVTVDLGNLILIRLR